MANKLIVRLISGIIYIALILGCYFCGFNCFVVLCFLFGAISVVEFTAITEGIKMRNLPLLIIDIICVIALIAFIGNDLSIMPWIIFLMLRLPAQLFYPESDSVKELSLSLFKQVYIGVGLGCMCALAAFPHWLLAILFFIWINDTGAYLVGTTFGKHRLFERISPKKSWEGFWGGLFLTLIASAVFCRYFASWFGIEENYFLWISIAVVTVLFSTWGDLVESQIKRTLKIKDSGRIIPGHGGILDRIDSLLLAMPAVWALLYFCC